MRPKQRSQSGPEEDEMSSTVGLLIGLAVGCGFAFVLLRALVTPRVKAVETERDGAIAQVAQVVRERDTAVQRAETAEGRVSDLQLESVRTAGEHSKTLELLRAELDTSKREGQEKLKLVTEATETMRAVLKDAAGEAFDGSGKKVVELTEAAVKTAVANNRADFERERKNVEQLVTPMKDNLTKLGDAVDKLDRDRERQHAELSEQMRGVVTGQLQVRDEAAVLSRALTQPKAAGDWGEFHLKRLVESAGMSEFCDFDVQVRADDDGRTLRPDVLIKMPGEKVVVVDSKTPLAPYREACAVADPDQQKRHLQLFARGVKAHVKKLSSKQYAERFPSALDFVVMYLPGDQFYSAALEFERSLIEEAVKHRVLIATPSTFLGLLRTIAYAWQQEKVAETARDIAEHGCTLYERLCVYLRHVDNVSRRMNSLVEAQNKAVGSLEHSVLPEARRFPELGAVAADKVLPETREVTREARLGQAEEFTVASERQLGPADHEAAGDVEATRDSDAAQSAGSNQEAA